MALRQLSFDAARTIRGKFKPSTAAERAFYKSLRSVAQVSGRMVESSISGVTIHDPRALDLALKRYSQQLEPWAVRQSAKLLESVQRSNKRAYINKSKAIGLAIEFGAGEDMARKAAMILLNEQVTLIKSIPLEAGQRAQKIALEAALHGTRAEPDEDTIAELKKQLGLTTEVATSRAKLIALTETARATAAINQSRAQGIGSNEYRWHNSADEAVRHAHMWYRGKRIQGRIFSWDDPPTLDDGTTGHPGTFVRCRCFAEPVFADE